MSQIPPDKPMSDAVPPPPAAPDRRSARPWIVGAIGLLVATPCLCCGGLLAYSMTVKEIKISNGQHNGGPPMNISFDYEFSGDGRGPTKAYYIVVQAANGSTRERSAAGQGFGITHIPLRGTWRFSDTFDPGPDYNKRPVKVWIESSGPGGGRSTASNTLTIYPKS